MPWLNINGVRVHVKMAKPRVKSCRVPLNGKLCRVRPAEWLCDSCDVAMCADCKVTAKPNGVERDFCGVCIEHVFRDWLKSGGNVGPVIATVSARAARRSAFRAWALRHPEAFASIPISKAGAA